MTIQDVIKLSKTTLDKKINPSKHSGKEIEFFDSRFDIGYNKLRNLARLRVDKEVVKLQIFDGKGYGESKYTEVDNVDIALQRITEEFNSREYWYMGE